MCGALLLGTALHEFGHILAASGDYAATGERIGPLLAGLRGSPTDASDISSEPDAWHRPRPQTMAAVLEQVDSSYLAC